MGLQAVTASAVAAALYDRRLRRPAVPSIHLLQTDLADACLDLKVQFDL